MQRQKSDYTTYQSWSMSDLSRFWGGRKLRKTCVNVWVNCLWGMIEENVTQKGSEKLSNQELETAGTK